MGYEQRLCDQLYAVVSLKKEIRLTKRTPEVGDSHRDLVRGVGGDADPGLEAMTRHYVTRHCLT